MKTFGMGSIYALGILGLSAIASTDPGWLAIAALIAVAFVWSVLFGLAADSWTALAAPPCVSCVFFALLMLLVLMLSSGGGADSDFSSVLTFLLAATVIAALQAFPVGIGLAIAHRWSDGPHGRHRP